MTSPLLELPAETRNRIYECVAWNTEIITAAPEGRITSPTAALLATCSQIHNEAASIIRHIAPLAASTITAAVHNLDFSHLIDVIESLPKSPSPPIEASRTVSIKVTVDKDCGDGTKRLEDWFSCCGDTTRAGLDFSTDYQYFEGALAKKYLDVYLWLCYDGEDLDLRESREFHEIGKLMCAPSMVSKGTPER
ncbi:hypothetical protein LTR36_001618 [Oleoguttula mirabilis]|uniref:Uncharacterized protein n=1 Tax=Oleoguttula mirabilis TaxID=1507867 RepID=A0AAV9JPD9_9PEZI|nr:hypothetical protein LTR36_001618 [Oleoguttula mirabilis]